MALLPLSRGRAVGTSTQSMFAPRSGGGPMVGMMRGLGGEGHLSYIRHQEYRTRGSRNAYSTSIARFRKTKIAETSITPP
jgi:hypothetical protein